MKKNWLILFVLIGMSFLLAGCPPPASDKGPESREAGDETPDLYKGRFMITDQSIDCMRGDGVPDDVVAKLEPLKGQTFENAREFFTAVSGAIGDEALNTYRDVIVRCSLITDLDADVARPGQQLAMGDGRFQPIYFDYDRSEVKAEFTEAISANAGVLTGEPTLQVVVEGHADERGTTEYNLALGQRRARSVQKALIEAGVDPGQLSIVSRGEEEPAARGSDEESWAKNRRAVFQQQ